MGQIWFMHIIFNMLLHIREKNTDMTLVFDFLQSTKKLIYLQIRKHIKYFFFKRKLAFLCAHKSILGILFIKDMSMSLIFI